MHRKIIEKIGKSKFSRRLFVRKKVKEYRKKKKDINAVLPLLRKECFCSINTLSIFAWWTIRETGDLTLIMREKREISPVEAHCLNIIYQELENEYIKVIGWSDEQKQIFELQNEIIEYSKKILPPECDDTLWTWLDIAQQNLKEIKSRTTGKANLLQIVVSLEKVCKVSLDIDKCSVSKFYAFIKMAENTSSEPEETEE